MSTDIIARLAAQPAGSSAVYHTGFLVKDRELSKAVAATAALAWQLAEAGHLLLTQRRVGEGTFEYIAKVIKKEKKS